MATARAVIDANSDRPEGAEDEDVVNVALDMIDSDMELTEATVARTRSDQYRSMMLFMVRLLEG